jgi:hypothetical protein
LNEIYSEINEKNEDKVVGTSIHGFIGGIKDFPSEYIPVVEKFLSSQELPNTTVTPSFALSFLKTRTDEYSMCKT